MTPEELAHWPACNDLCDGDAHWMDATQTNDRAEARGFLIGLLVGAAIGYVFDLVGVWP